MYTKCPECQTAFRVTANILKQAGGRVRCGGCGRAFNALERLSEGLAPAEEPSAEDEFSGRSKTLLETLDQLAGPGEVRIEDTGVEWRVLDHDDDETPDDAVDPDSTGSVRWFIEEDDQEAEHQDAGDAIIPEISDSVDPADRAAADENRSNNPDEMRFDDNTPLPDDFVDSDDDAYTPPLMPQRRAADQQQQQRAEFEELQVDLALGEPDDWMDLLDEVDESAAGAAGSIPLEVEEELAAIHSELSTGQAPPAVGPDDTAHLLNAPPGPADLESQFELQAEAMGLGLHEEQQPAEELTEAEGDEAAASFESTGHFEQQISVARDALARQFDEEKEDDDVAADDAPADESPGEALKDDRPEQEQAATDADETPPETPTRHSDHVVPPPTEEEMTINEQIDKELLAAATTDEEFATTMVEDPESLFDEDSPDVETIVMEGDLVSASFEKKRRAAEKEAASKLGELGPLADTYSITRDKVRGGRRKTDPPSFGLIVGMLLLALLLLGQFMHGSRETLSTYGAFNQTLGPVYRILGQPVTPEWDVTGWQFQATNGATDENEKVLTIFSRIVNRAGQPLPYPLVHVSLTDRWEEIIGSRVLEPNEYLAGDLDPSRPVAAGDSFTAVITIEDPSADATGFKLNVCYRISPGRVRCATEDFKD